MEGRNTTTVERDEGLFSKSCPYCGLIIECYVASRLDPALSCHKIICKKEKEEKEKLQNDKN